MTLTVFLCDDAEAYRSLIRRVLEASSDLHVIGEACDGEQCIARVEHAAPDVILLDVNMPRLDGCAAIPGLRDAAPDAAIVMLSTSPALEQESECLRLGARAYIQKPRDVFALPDLVSRALT